MTRIITARQQYDLLSPWMKESAVPMVTLYSKPACPQCDMTHKLLDKEGIEHRVIDLTQDADAYRHVTENLGYKGAPVVHAGGDNHWSGFRPDLVRALKG